MSSKNSLSTLLGNYMSDSDNENEENPKTNSFSQEIGNLISEIGGETSDKKQQLPKTEWTQCMDVNSGHPYYWNIESKEVTWEKPAQYDDYLKELKRVVKKIPNDSWAIGYAEGSETPYYLNVFTREISWQKPLNFKEKKKSKTPKKRKQHKETKQVNEKEITNRKLLNEKETIDRKLLIEKETTKKKYPKHLENGSDEEIKIELIHCFSNKSGASSSDDEEKNKAKIKKEQHSEIDNQKSTKIKLVAAYATDDEEECEPSVNEIITIKSNIASPESSQASQKSNTNNEKPKITSFASIITGGKVEGVFDEEINKLKEELEKDLVKTQKDDEIKSENSAISSIKSNIDVSFDEKNFKRKRRIEFGTSGKSAQNIDDNENEDSRPSFVFASNSDDSKELISKENSNSEKLLGKKNLYSNFTRSHIAFLKTDENKNDNSPKETNEESSPEEKIKFDNEIKELSDLIFGKVKFLSVGHADVSAVQAIHIQLETLLAAFKSSSLASEYFFKWLKQTSDDLMKLEQNAAPDGWKCKWDRTTAQYFYENLTTNEISWEFPKILNENESNSNVAKDQNDEEVENLLSNTTVNKIIHIDHQSTNDDDKGEMEMDISTTPPPNEHEKIVVQHAWDAENPPPPPRFNTPSPSSLSTSEVINDELSAFYSDIAKISEETGPSGETQSTGTSNNDIIESSSTQMKRSIEISEQQQQLIEKKKRKKMKVSGLSMGDKGVTEMVAKWQKAQQQKGYNFW